MEFKRCVRCGCFFTSDSDICVNCESKERLEINKLNNFIRENEYSLNAQELADNTNISINNINRYIKNDSLKNF